MRATRAAMAIGIAAIVVVVAASSASSATSCRPGPGARCAGADLDGAKLAGRNLTGATLTRAGLVGARLQRARLLRADLSRANLTRARLRGADLRGARLFRARLRGADLRGAKLGAIRGTARTATIASGCTVASCTGDLRYADLRGADLRGAIIDLAKFGRADLRGVRFTHVFMQRTSFTDARLDDASFYLADIHDVDFRGASLQRADFRGAVISHKVDLRGADLNGANLSGVDLSKARIDAADLAGANIDGAILPPSVQNSIPQTKATAATAFTATMTSGKTTVTCTQKTECAAAATFNSSWTLAVTTSWAGFAMCPDGPVRLTAGTGGTYTGSCTYTAFQGLVIRILPARTVTVRVVDLVGEPATIARIGGQWREPPSFGLVEAEHECLGSTGCAMQYPDGAHLKLAITGSSPYHVPTSASCQGGTVAGDTVIVSGAPWQLTCLVGANGEPLPLTTDREIVVTLS